MRVLSQNIYVKLLKKSNKKGFSYYFKTKFSNIMIDF